MDFGINYSLFRLEPSYFDHQSKIHGINHTYRVMYHVVQLAGVYNLKREGIIALCAAFIHDLARMNDGYCTLHGKWAAERKLPVHKELFHQLGIINEDLKIIETAVINHSINFELERNDIAYLVTALLKDADALDRIRLGDDFLDVSYLRFPKTKTMIKSAKEIFFSTDKMSFCSFAESFEFINKL